MDFFIKKIFEGNTDERVHLQFQKFSKGVFKNKAALTAKCSKGNYSISTTPEYANEFVRCLAEKLGDRKTHVGGIIVSTRDLSDELDYEDKKQFMGVKQYVINKEISGKEIVSLCDKLPNAFFGLSFSVDGSDLKIKQKAPKSAKPSTKAEETIKIDFCKLKTNDAGIVRGLIFDDEVRDFKQIEIIHEFVIDEIVIPDALKKEKDFAVVREKALKKGIIVRKIKIDGKEIRKEKEFAA
ncbi:MAG: hypothetical protein RL557_443 [archaeon]|jgi:hypothetical protein